MRKPRLSDIEIIAIDLTSEFMDFDSERDLFRKLPATLASRVKCSVYNRKKKGRLSLKTQKVNSIKN